jgi:CO/xanthine dehydrogenase Mo-binding subunit
MKISRREFTSWVASSGIALGLSRVGLAQVPGFDARETLPGRHGWNPAAMGTGRIDGPVKVTGAKLYASDFRAADLPGWPSSTSHALLIRATDATHVFEGIDLSRLSGGLKPARVITEADLATADIRVPAFYAGDLLCPVGKTALYLGQPVALLIFETFDAFDQARLALRHPSCVKYGRETGPVPGAPYGAHRFVRVAGATPDAPDVYSPLQAGWIAPRGFRNVDTPVWAPANRQGPADARASYHGEQIRAALAANDPDQFVLEREFTTQSVDPMFLEPEAGLAWYDGRSRALELVVGVQSPYEATESVAFLLGSARGNLKPTRIHTHFAYVGGGFGGRDHTIMPLYIALAAMFLPDRPVRLANNRYEQFQSGIKRHAFRMRSRIGISRATGRMTAFAADHVLDGGGLANFSANVADVAATGAIGIYDIPRVDVTTVAVHSRAVTAGSMRCYGTVQTMTALEVLIDEAATALKLDPIEFRRRNALRTRGRTMTGNPYNGEVRTGEILDRLAAHSLWTERADEKARGQRQAGSLVGTGVACVTKDFGTGADGTLASVEIAPDGSITILSDSVEMGNAIGTALANRVAGILGGVADEVALAQVEAFRPLELVTSGDPWTIDQATQDAAARNPRWVPQISSPTSSSAGAHVFTHAAAEAARIVFRFGLWPAALELWGIARSDPRARQWDKASWKDRKLALAELQPLELAALAAKAHAHDGVTAAMVHGFSRWAWSQSSFRLAGETWTADIDALAVRMGNGPAPTRGTPSAKSFVRLNRTSMKIPPTVYQRFGTAYTSACGSLVRIELERATGNLRIAKAYTVVECGQALVPQVVLGQAQGGFAMGVGYALLEDLPLYEDGPGNGKWNLGRYTIARATDLPLDGLEIEILPAYAPDDYPKGIAEVVMIPIVPAILNAIFDATGHRFHSLPVTQAMLKGVLS